MKFVAIIMTFIGYVLVYAGVANGGKFATQPWMGIIDDAYSQGSSAGASAGGSGGSASSNAGSAAPTQKGTHIMGGGTSQSSSNTTPSQKSSGGSVIGNAIKSGLSTLPGISIFFGGGIP